MADVEGALHKLRASSVTWIVGAAIMFTAAGVFGWANLSGRVADLEKAQALKVTTDAAAQKEVSDALRDIKSTQNEQGIDIGKIVQRLDDMVGKK